MRAFRNRRTLAYAAIGLLILLCFSAPALAFAAYNVAYFAAPPPSQTPPATWTVAPSPAAPSATATAAPLCGGPRAMFILLVGSDSRADNYSAGLADSIRVVRVDFVDPGISYLSFAARSLC